MIFRLCLRNTGERNAKDPIVDLTLPDGLEFTNLPIWFPPPLLVPHPHSSYDPGRDYYGKVLVPKLSAAPTNRIEPYVGDTVNEGRNRDDRKILRYTFRVEVPHQSEAEIAKVHLTFEPDHIPREAFEVPYTAFADGAPPFPGRLLVKWR